MYYIYEYKYIIYVLIENIFQVQQNVLTPRIGYGYFQNILMFYSISKNKKFLVFVVPALC